SRLVPEGEHHLVAAGDSLQCLLERVQVRSMPGREEHRAVLAVAAPPGGIGRALVAEGLAVVATKHEERTRVVRRQVLDALPGPHEHLERLLVAAVVLRLDLGQRSTDTGCYWHEAPQRLLR